VFFEIYQIMNEIFLSKPLYCFGFVSVNSNVNIAGDSYIQCPLFVASEDVYIILVHNLLLRIRCFFDGFPPSRE
jgi:hypothetical protein